MTVPSETVGRILMMKIEFLKQSIHLNLHLANRCMEKGDFVLAIFRLQDARQLLEELDLIRKKIENDNL